jgi:hypothetical protein
MTITIATALLSYFVDAALVGGMYAILSKKLSLPTAGWKRFALLVAIFVILDLVWLPAVSELQMTISFENPAVYTFLSIESPIDGTTFFAPSGIDFFFWLFQAVVAGATATRVLRSDWAAA